MHTKPGGLFFTSGESMVDSDQRRDNQKSYEH